MNTCETIVLPDEEEIAAAASPWEAIRQRQSRPHIEHSPDWFTIHCLFEHDAVPTVVKLSGEGALLGVAALTIRQRWNWNLKLGYKSITRFPMRMADLCGETLLAPETFAAQEELLSAALDAANSDIVFLESLPVNSILWDVVNRSRAIRSHYWVYLPQGVTPHRMLRLDGDFEAYLGRFSKDTGRKLKQEVRKLPKVCGSELSLRRITRAEELPAFLKAAEILSRKSWQGTRLGQIIRCDETTSGKLSAYAERGWLRGYLLESAERPFAFLLGCQESGVYYAEYTGYDPEWVKYSPGKVLWYRVIEDLCQHEPANWLDFRYGDNTYKRIFSNESYDEANVYLIRKSAYGSLAYAAQRSCACLSRGVRTALDGLGLRERVRHALRGVDRVPPGGV